jgi:hypothetical protein|nr:MAG TPA: hypothetical protein [Caudoviricetes sp.]
MTIQEAITYANAVKPNAFDNDTLTRWLNEVEGMVQTQVLLLRTEAIITYTYEKDANTTMLVRPPHDKLYPAYLEARIDFANGEYERYQNTYQLFNSFFKEFARWYATNYNPAEAYEEGLI